MTKVGKVAFNEDDSFQKGKREAQVLAQVTKITIFLTICYSQVFFSLITDRTVLDLRAHTC